VSDSHALCERNVSVVRGRLTTNAVIDGVAAQLLHLGAVDFVLCPWNEEVDVVEWARGP